MGILKSKNNGRSEITEVAPISELPLLTHLNLRENAINNIDALQKLRNLQLLDVGVNHLIDKNIEKDFDFVNTLKTDRNPYNYNWALNSYTFQILNCKQNRS